MKEVVIVYKEGDTVPKNVTKLIFDSSVTEIRRFAFRGCFHLKVVVLNEGLVNIGERAFYNCTTLTIIKLPSTVTEVGPYAFDGCTNLREVILNEGLQRIENAAFDGCVLLTIIKLPSSVTEIGYRAFHNCTNLREVVFNEGLVNIGHNAFWCCTSLNVIKLPSTVTEVGARAFNDCAFDACPRTAVVKFPSISERAKNLIDLGITEIVDKLTANQYFEWRGGELLVSREAIKSANWRATRTHLDRVLAWVSYYELREAATSIALAHWKMKIEETGAATVEERDACRGEIPGPVKDAIIQYLKVDIGVDDNGSDDSSQYSDSSSDDESDDY